MTKESNQSRLIIGILVDNPVVQIWQYDLIDKLIQSPFVDLKLLILKYDHPGHGNLKPFVYTIHEWFDKIVFKAKNPYNSKKDAYDLFDPSAALNIEFFKGRPTSQDMEILSSKNFDLIINFTSEIKVQEIAGVTNYGVWQYQVGERPVNFEYSDGYLEIIKKSPELGITILALSQKGPARIIFKTNIFIYRHSLFVNRNRAYHLAVTYFTRAIRTLYQQRDTFFLSRPAVNTVSAGESTSNGISTPGSLYFIWNMFLLFYNFINGRLHYKDIVDYAILYRSGDQSFQLPPNLENFIVIASSKDRFWADPFPFFKNGRQFIFFEELIIKTDKGHIAFLEIDPQGNILQKKDIIVRPYHMSYPLLLEHDNELYMVPETSANKTIEMYKCTSFPDQWEFAMNLMEGVSAADTTLFFHNDYWWLFTSLKAPNSDLVSELHLFYSRDVLSKNWISHPANPIISDIKYERCAGNILVTEDRLYRPSQDCSGFYGKAINFNEICTLDVTNYREKLVSRIERMDYSIPTGTHTFNFIRGSTVMDVHVKRKRFFNNTINRNLKYNYSALKYVPSGHP